MGSAVSGQANLLVRPEAPADAEASRKTWSMLGLGLQQAEGKFYEFSIRQRGRSTHRGSVWRAHGGAAHRAG